MDDEYFKTNVALKIIQGTWIVMVNTVFQVFVTKF